MLFTYDTTSAVDGSKQKNTIAKAPKELFFEKNLPILESEFGTPKQKIANSWVSSKKKCCYFFQEVACFQWAAVEIPTCTLKWWSQEILNKNTKAFPVINGPPKQL